MQFGRNKHTYGLVQFFFSFAYLFEVALEIAPIIWLPIPNALCIFHRRQPGDTRNFLLLYFGITLYNLQKFFSPLIVTIYYLKSAFYVCNLVSSWCEITPIWPILVTCCPHDKHNATSRINLYPLLNWYNFVLVANYSQATSWSARTGKHMLRGHVAVTGFLGTCPVSRKSSELGPHFVP